jgi:hypothetical protein
MLCSDAMLRRTVGSSGAEDPATKSSLLAFTRPSNKPLLTHRFIWCYCVDLGTSLSCLNLTSDRPKVPSNGPSVHPTLLSSRLLFSNSSDATREGTVGSSDGIKLTPVIAKCTKCSDAMHRWYRRFIRWCLLPCFSSRLQLGSLLQLNILNMPLLIASKYIVNPQFCCK